MPAEGQTYYIAGAGITGMTLALALAKFGANVVLLERNPAISEFGAGLQISANARRVLDSLGLSEAVSANGLVPEGIDIYPAGRASPIMTLELGRSIEQRFGAPYAVMHRADLADVLYKATRRFANIDIMFGVGSWDAASHEKGVTLSIDGADGQTRTVRGRALIGADGVHSFTRRTLLRGPDAAYQGRVAWRALLPQSAVAGCVALDRVSVFLAPDLHVVCYPLPHRGQVNVALFSPRPENAELSGSTPGLPAKFRPRGPLAAILDAAGQNWTPWPLYGVETSTWHLGNIGLVGDAAHAMVPFQAQGAAMGIEDAGVLAPLLVTTPSAEDALAQYAALRRARTTRVARQSAANGRIFHLHWPLSAARNLAVRLQGPRGHFRRLQWLYGYDVGQAIARTET